MTMPNVRAYYSNLVIFRLAPKLVIRIAIAEFSVCALLLVLFQHLFFDLLVLVVTLQSLKILLLG